MKFLNLLYHTYRTSAKAHLSVTQVLHEIILGKMLGDIHAEKPSTKHNTRLQFKHSSIQQEYITHLFELFGSYCGTNPITLSWYDPRPNRMKTYTAIKFQTLSIPCFNIYRELFYNNLGVKFIPVNLTEMFTARSLAYWFMDDGYKFTNGYYLCTESFSDKDINLLLEMLCTKFNLDCSAHVTTNGLRIYIKNSSVNDFNKLISPYILDCFKYKLHENIPCKSNYE